MKMKKKFHFGTEKIRNRQGILEDRPVAKLRFEGGAWGTLSAHNKLLKSLAATAGRKYKKWHPFFITKKGIKKNAVKSFTKLLPFLDFSDCPAHVVFESYVFSFTVAAEEKKNKKN